MDDETITGDFYKQGGLLIIIYKFLLLLVAYYNYSQSHCD